MCLEEKKSVVMCVGECTWTKILSCIFCCCHARGDCGTEFCGVPMAPVNAAPKDLSNECGVQWVLTKPQGSGASQARHHRKKQHRGAMAPPTANLNGKGRRERPKSKVKLTGKENKIKSAPQKSCISRNRTCRRTRELGTLSRLAKRLRLDNLDENKI